MYKKINLDIWSEEVVLEQVLNSPEKIMAIPSELYNKFFDYLMQDERYEDIQSLEIVKDKIVDRTIESFFNEK